MSQRRPELILLTGATGYVGGRLLRALEEQGRLVRCLVRRPEFLSPRVSAATQVARGDVLKPENLRPSMTGVTTAFYMIHSMASGGSFAEQDRRAARAFAQAARDAGVRRIVYLGGLGRGSSLSPHLASRHEVGQVLRSADVPVIELRASIIIGSGSLSFEMVRALVEKLPIMVTPRWVNLEAQPIAVEDIIDYLIEAIDVEEPGSRVFEIGGRDRVSYREIMREYARQRGLRRLVVPIPVLTPRLSSLWLGLVTPVYARIGRHLIDSVRHDTVVHDRRAMESFTIRPRGLQEAIARALANEEREYAETRWSDALSSCGSRGPGTGVPPGPRLLDSRSVEIDQPPACAFRTIQCIGGGRGWYYANWIWRLRGFIDLLLGGPGMRRGRRDPVRLRRGDTLDFWRVEEFQPDRMLRLLAEMKVPGRAWLQFEVEERPGGGSLVRQTALFDPHGLAGLLYWYALYPIHKLVFQGMLRNLARAVPGS